MDRSSNQNQNRNTSKSDAPSYTLLSANEYISSVKNAPKQSGLVYNESVFQSLLHYERQISLLKGHSKLLGFQITKEFKTRAYNQLFNYMKDLPIPTENLNEEETNQVKSVGNEVELARELAEVIEEKVENERRQQEEFLELMRNQIFEDQVAELESVSELTRLLQQKINGKYALGWRALVEPNREQQATKKALKNPFIVKNILLGTFALLGNKIREHKEFTFRNILKQFGLASITEQLDATMKFKGKVLMGLKEYPRLNLKRAFWRWYLNTTDTGESLFQRAADQLVLYTNINKTTAFYRLFNKVKGRRRIVSPKTKRMTIMLYLYTKIFYDRPLREFFEKFKIAGAGKESQVVDNIVECAKSRQIGVMKLWINKMKSRRSELDQEERIKNIQKNFLKRMMQTKIGRVVQAFKAMKALPERKDNSAFIKASRFEKGLATFAERTLKRALGAFRNEYEEGQAAKKRAVIQLIDTTMGGQKKMYNRWKSITEKTRLMNECRQITSLFQTLNFAIKSVADLAFVDNKDSALKEKALIQLFKNLAGNMSDCFKRWRDINSIEKLRERMSNVQKESLLKVLNGLLTTGKTAQVREAINKFRLNRRITEIQRNFLKRLLMSKAGLVVIAFRKVQALPERKDNTAFIKASRFEKGLALFAERTLKRALGAFKNEFEEGQAMKKRAVIQLIDTTMGGQKKMYNRWITSVKQTKLYERCKLLSTLFENTHNAINRNIGSVFIKPQYGMEGISKLHKYFTKICTNTNENLKTCIKNIKAYAEEERINPWFKRAATILSLNTKINIQKSFWRMKYNMNTNGVTFNAAIIVKIKKMFNNIRKYYELNMFRAFLMIDKYGKSLADPTSRRSRVTSDYSQIQQRRALEEDTFTDEPSQQTEVANPKYDTLIKKTSLSIIDRVFKRNLTKQLKKWQFNAQPERKLEYVHADLAEKSKEEYDYVAKVGALESLRKLSEQAAYKAKVRAFRNIVQHMYNKRTETDYDQSLEERLELINRQNILMEEIRTYKDETEALQGELQTKERNLKEANEIVTTLTLRINYIITQKFVNMIEKVWEEIEYRHLNDAFDGLIDQANRNYEKEGGYGEEEYEDV